MEELPTEELIGLNRFIIDCNSQGLKISFPDGLSEGNRSLAAYSCENGHEGFESLLGISACFNSCPKCWNESDDWLTGGA